MNDLVLKNCTIVGLNGDKEKQSIFINEQGKIEKIVEGKIIDGEFRNFIDCTDKFIMPGLINAHAHLFSSGRPLSGNLSDSALNMAYALLESRLGRSLLRKVMTKNSMIALQSGVTTIRSVGEFFYEDVWLRDQYISKKKVGPNLMVSGFFLSVTDGHGAPYLSLESDSPWEGRKSVRKNIKKGVDWIKICITGGVTDAQRVGEAGALQFTLEEVSAICDEAHKNGVMVAAHVESTEGVRIGLKAGVDTIEHGAPMDEEIINLYKDNQKSLRGYSALIPTFQAAAPFALLDRNETGVTNTVYKNGKMVYNGMLTSFRQAIEHEIMVGVGNDASMSFVTHYDFWRELDHQIRYGGLDPRVALHNVTQINAEILGIEKEYGSVDVGKYADLLVLNENPASNIRSLKNIEMVIKDGKPIKKKRVNKNKTIDSLLDKF